MFKMIASLELGDGYSIQIDKDNENKDIRITTFKNNHFREEAIFNLEKGMINCVGKTTLISNEEGIVNGYNAYARGWEDAKNLALKLLGTLENELAEA